MVDSMFITIIGLALIGYVMKRAFLTSFHDKCYEEMENRGNAVFGMCSGQMGGDYETKYLSYSCLDCPYFDISVLKKDKNNVQSKSVTDI